MQKAIIRDQFGRNLPIHALADHVNQEIARRIGGMIDHLEAAGDEASLRALAAAFGIDLAAFTERN